MKTIAKTPQRSAKVAVPSLRQNRNKVPATGEASPMRFGNAAYQMRPLNPGDEATLQAFFASHSAETIHDRYGYFISTMTPERASQLVGVDQSRDCALGIFDSSKQPALLHAVGRFCLDANGKSGEAAFVVRESMRGLGMASTLMDALIATARARGMISLWAKVDCANAPMIAVLSKFGFELGIPGPEGEIFALLALSDY